jgi:hypothetical protein
VAWVTNSSFAGYFGPKGTPAPQPLEDDAFDDFLHDVIAGVTGLDNKLVRPGWQKEPPNQPDIDTDWVGFRVTNQVADWMPAVVHDDAGDGQDLYQRHVTTTVLCVFYGPSAGSYAALLRDGLGVWQNQAALRAASIALVELGDFTSAPELFRQQWLNRVDTNMVLRREIRRNYPVLNLLRATGTVVGNGGTSEIRSRFDTGETP